MLNLIIRYLIGYPKKTKISKNYSNKCKSNNIEILPYFSME